MARITRRLLLGSAGLAALGGAAYGVSRIACSFVPRNHPDFFSLLDLAPDDEAARRIGRLALAAADGPPGDLVGLAEALAGRSLTRAALAESCPTTRAGLVKDQCALDFAEGRVVVLDGWLLSRTEAELCAAKTLCGGAA
jgi:hypothetical protein